MSCHIYTCTCMHMYTHKYICLHTHSHICMCTHTYTHSHAHAHMHAHTCTTRIYTQTNTHVYTHTCTHIHTHTHIHRKFNLKNILWVPSLQSHWLSAHKAEGAEAWSRVQTVMSMMEGLLGISFSETGLCIVPGVRFVRALRHTAGKG